MTQDRSVGKDGLQVNLATLDLIGLKILNRSFISPPLTLTHTGNTPRTPPPPKMMNDHIFGRGE